MMKKLGLPVGVEVVLCPAQQALPLSTDVWSVPVDCL
jgi:hypothetical protein